MIGFRGCIWTLTICPLGVYHPDTGSLVAYGMTSNFPQINLTRRLPIRLDRLPWNLSASLIYIQKTLLAFDRQSSTIFKDRNFLA